MHRNWYLILILAAVSVVVVAHQIHLTGGLKNTAVPRLIRPPEATDQPEIGNEDAVERLRNEIRILNDEIEQREARAAQRIPKPTTPTDPQKPVPWSNLGRASPEAVFETALWSAAHGEVDTLAQVIELDEQGKAEAASFHASLPPKNRDAFANGEELVATMLASRIPRGIESTTIVRRTAESNTEVALYVQIDGKGRKPVETKFRFSHGQDGWKLQVPSPVVEGFRYNATGFSVYNASPSRE